MDPDDIFEKSTSKEVSRAEDEEETSSCHSISCLIEKIDQPISVKNN